MFSLSSSPVGEKIKHKLIKSVYKTNTPMQNVQWKWKLFFPERIIHIKPVFSYIKPILFLPHTKRISKKKFHLNNSDGSGRTLTHILHAEISTCLRPPAADKVWNQHDNHQCSQCAAHCDWNNIRRFKRVAVHRFTEAFLFFGTKSLEVYIT